jgi:hypothetical protein
MLQSMSRSQHKHYHEFQFSWLAVGILVPMQLLITYFYINRLGDNPMPPAAYWSMTALFAIIVLLFYAMTTTIDDEFVTVSFGIGLIRKRISLERIKSVFPVTSPWYYGYGIRLIPNGWLYNVSGSRGVELKFVDRKEVIRIGTRNPGALTNAIEKTLTTRAPS